MRTLIFLLLFLFLAACNNDTLIIDEVYHIQQNGIKKSNDFYPLLNNSSEIAVVETPFSFAVSFQISNININNIEILKEEDYIFYNGSLQDNKPLTATINVENLTGNNKDLTFFVFNEYELIPTRIKNNEIWAHSLKLNAESNYNSEVEIEIIWDNKADTEISLFILDKSLPKYYYYSPISNIIRKAIIANDFKGKKIPRKIKSNNDFNIDLNLIPIFIDQDGIEVEMIIQGDETFIKNKIAGLKINSVDFETEITTILFDERGNSTLLAKEVGMNIGEDFFIDLPVDFYKNDPQIRQFILIKNNNGGKMIQDAYSINIDEFPFITTQQTIIEIPPLKELGITP